MEPTSIYRLCHRHHSELLRLPEQQGRQRTNWRNALLPLCILDRTVCKWNSILGQLQDQSTSYHGLERLEGAEELHQA
jgi:hypothetical protein